LKSIEKYATGLTKDNLFEQIRNTIEASKLTAANGKYCPIPEIEIKVKNWTYMHDSSIAV
jgi:hypothetical protein